MDTFVISRYIHDLFGVPMSSSSYVFTLKSTWHLFETCWHDWAANGWWGRFLFSRLGWTISWSHLTKKTGIKENGIVVDMYCALMCNNSTCVILTINVFDCHQQKHMEHHSHRLTTKPISRDELKLAMVMNQYEEGRKAQRQLAGMSIGVRSIFFCKWNQITNAWSSSHDRPLHFFGKWTTSAVAGSEVSLLLGSHHFVVIEFLLHSVGIAKGGFEARYSQKWGPRFATLAFSC